MAFTSGTLKFAELEGAGRANAASVVASALAVNITLASAVCDFLRGLRTVPVAGAGAPISASANANIDFAISVTSSLYTLKVSVGP